MTSTKELRGKALRTLRDQIQAIRANGDAQGLTDADEQARYGREFQTGLDAVVRTLENQIKQCADHPEEPEPLKSDAAAEVRRLRGALRQLAELPNERMGEVKVLAMKALIEPPAQAPARRPGPPQNRKFTPRRPENRGRSNSGR